jgi:hypothetical protein
MRSLLINWQVTGACNASRGPGGDFKLASYASMPGHCEAGVYELPRALKKVQRHEYALEMPSQGRKMTHAIIRSKNSRRHEVDFGDAWVRAEVYTAPGHEID